MIGMSGSAATRYVALGDSITEGVGDDPHADGTPRGWADRLAELMAAHGPVGYANLAVRGRRTREVVETQLETAAAAAPTIATVSAGVNDLLRPRLDLDALAADLALIAARLTGVGAQVLFVPLPAVERVTPLGHLLRPRREALNTILATWRSATASSRCRPRRERSSSRRWPGRRTSCTCPRSVTRRWPARPPRRWDSSWIRGSS